MLDFTDATCSLISKRIFLGSIKSFGFYKKARERTETDATTNDNSAAAAAGGGGSSMITMVAIVIVGSSSLVTQVLQLAFFD